MISFFDSMFQAFNERVVPKIGKERIKPNHPYLFLNSQSFVADFEKPLTSPAWLKQIKTRFLNQLFNTFVEID